MRRLAKWRAALGLALLVSCAAIVLAACGGGGSSSSSSTSSGSGGEESSTVSSNEGGNEESGGGSVAGIAAPVTVPPTEIPITKPLKEKPKPENVTWLACSLPVCQSALSEGYHQAAGALGWPIKQINYETVKAAEAVQQALNENPDVIQITGVPVVVYETQAQEAIAKEIPIISGYDTTPAEPQKNGLWYQYSNGINGSGAQGEEVARWIAADSEGKGSVVTVTISEYPILTAEIEGIEKVAAEAPEMSVDTIAVTSEEVGEGKVPSKVVAYLQSHPETEYIEYTFSDLATGMKAALQGAGLTDITQTGGNASPAVVKEIADGDQTAWTMQPSLYGDWLAMDAAARIAQGMPLEKYQDEGALPTYVVASPEAAEELLTKSKGEWAGPEGFEEKFEELWGVK
jgi:ABC-type sugar transport system substrate-binding protein